MLHGYNVIGAETSAAGTDVFQSFSTVEKNYLPERFHVATQQEVDHAIAKAVKAFAIFRNTTFVQRALFLETIAECILETGDSLLRRAHLETGLPLARLTGERDRTMNQLKLFAALLREGSWTDAVIDTALPERKPLPRSDLRRMLQPLGPVAVFAASNFPFAFSTAGGDTASALAAGCPVIVKAHSSHAGTNEFMARAIQKAAGQTGMPDGVFSSLNGGGATLGQTLAADPAIKAIGFTGSYRAGMSLFATATQKRETPIPVYAEMSSINPVVLLPGTLAARVQATAGSLAASITLGVGQFCTNPGLLFVIRDAATDSFLQALAAALQTAAPGIMLNTAICKSYYTDRTRLTGAAGVTLLTAGEDLSLEYKASPALLQVPAKAFREQPQLQDEVFGPCSLAVVCEDRAELEQTLDTLHGQLTGSLFGTATELSAYRSVAERLQQKVGRLIFNAVPTGVEVCHAMVHGGPFPATTDSRSTSVGTEAIRRFVRPVCYQDCPQELLPLYLQDTNEAGILRKVNGNYTREPIGSNQQ
ncbi:aldehyde dehydrogenase (NADP(+)) [Sediminibacterium soli]|uniref:aldehyde dehydrogenase (NADP(+)) n=1 Tax=Sediminibacterium soli TaxID=2698829 RepID=UPI00137AC612|nr:aldehyde dehydrogenase (NADP(+)) [Sediminibacterium soli]NCI46786.1 aldehyde dehydrogenase (NADP(+)) [Sediminibacterium soli]